METLAQIYAVGDATTDGRGREATSAEPVHSVTFPFRLFRLIFCSFLHRRVEQPHASTHPERGLFQSTAKRGLQQQRSHMHSALMLSSHLALVVLQCAQTT